MVGVISAMCDFDFHVITHDRTVLSRWRFAFKREGWEFQDEAPACLHSVEHADIYLVEVGGRACRNPEELQKLIASRKPAATLIFAPGNAVTNQQIVSFLESGADDFFFSDTDERVVVAKLKAYLRRMAPAISTALTKLESSSGDILIDRDRRAVRIKVYSGKYTELSTLTQKELGILSMLVGNEKRAVSRESMLEYLWGDAASRVYSDCINKHIETLRKKLGPFGKRIKTVYGSGYMFV